MRERLNEAVLFSDREAVLVFRPSAVCRFGLWACQGFGVAVVTEADEDDDMHDVFVPAVAWW